MKPLRLAKAFLLVVTVFTLPLRAYEGKTTRNMAYGTSAALGAAALTTGALFAKRMLAARRHAQLRTALRNPAIRNLLITSGLTTAGAVAALATALQYAPPSPEDIMERFGHNQDKMDKAIAYWYSGMNSPRVQEMQEADELPEKIKALAKTQGDTDASVDRAEKLQKGKHRIYRFFNFQWKRGDLIKSKLNGVDLEFRHRNIFNTKDNYCFYHALMYGLTGYNYLGGMLIPHFALYLPKKMITNKTIQNGQNEVRKHFYDLTGRTIIDYQLKKIMGVPYKNHVYIHPETIDPNKPEKEWILEGLFIHTRRHLRGGHAELLEVMNRNKTRAQLNRQALDRMLDKLKSTLFINHPWQEQRHREFCLFVDIYILSKASELSLEWKQEKSMQDFMAEIELKDQSFKNKVREVVTQYLDLALDCIRDKKLSYDDAKKFLQTTDGVFLHDYLKLTPDVQQVYANRINRLWPGMM